MIPYIRNRHEAAMRTETVNKVIKRGQDGHQGGNVYVSTVMIIIVFLLQACTPSSSTGKKPEFYYKDAKVIELCNAISRNDEAAVDELLKQGVDINAIGKEGMTPLWWAFSLNSKSRFEMVLKKGGNPNIRTQLEYGLSVMNLAIQHKDRNGAKQKRCHVF